jgi:hypothetical protein
VAKRAHRIGRPNPRSLRRNQDPSGIGIADPTVGPAIVVLAAWAATARPLAESRYRPSINLPAHFAARPERTNMNDNIIGAQYTAPCQEALPTTELPSTFVAHVGSQITCHLTIRTAALQVVSHDVVEPLSQTRVILQDPAETTPTVRPKFWANVQAPSRNSVT